MKAVVLTQNAPVYVPAFLDELLLGLAEREIEVLEAIVAPLLRRGVVPDARKRLALYGPVAFSRMAAHIGWAKLSAKRDGGRGVAGVLRRHGVPERHVDVNEQGYVASLNERAVDLLISVLYPFILRQQALDVPRLGCLNYHAALLPRYRGLQPLFWALFHGESEVGVSVHEMVAGIDAGPIIVQERIPIEPSDSVHDLFLKTSRVGPRAVLLAVDMLVSGNRLRLGNADSDATYFGFPSVAEAREFRRRGSRFF